MTADFRALCAELLAWAERTSAHYVVPPHVILRARAALSAPEQGPTDEEVDALVICIQGLPVPDADDLALPSTGRGRDMVRRALARWGRPAVEPVPVAERLPGPDDCDDQGRCWLGTPASDVMDAYWVYRKAEHRRSCDTHWLPHWAFPVPQEGADG